MFFSDQKRLQFYSIYESTLNYGTPCDNKTSEWIRNCIFFCISINNFYLIFTENTPTIAISSLVQPPHRAFIHSFPLHPLVINDIRIADVHIAAHCPPPHLFIILSVRIIS